MPNILEIRDLMKSFGGLMAVNQVSLSVPQGEIWGLIGPNGAGKTTLFNLITGTYSPNQGKITYEGEDITGIKPHLACHKGIGRTFQVTKPFGASTVFENVLIASFSRRSSKKRAAEKADEIIDLVGLGDKKNVLANHLTLINRKLLEVARALATEPRLLLLDEVMAGLNDREINDAIKLIERIKQTNLTIVVIEHIFKVILQVTTRVVVLDQGQKIAEGKPSEVIEDENVLKAYFGEDYAFA